MHSNRKILLVLAACLLFTGIPQLTARAQQAPASSSPNPELDKLLAPIALYPDSLLAQVLACASSPQQVTDVIKWLEQNQGLQGTELQEAAKAQEFDASFVAMVLFPDVLQLMAKNLDWTTEVGKAFVSDQKGVLASVQRLRAQAQAAGNLKTTAEQTVTTKTEGGQQVIVIQPANPQVVYVPAYDSQAAYAPPPAQESSDTGGKIAAGLIGFGLGVALGAAMDNDYYYGPYGWGGWGMGWHTGGVVVVGGAWRVPPGRYAYVRPVPYRGAYRPNNVYAPRYNNVNVNVDRSRNTNINRPTTVNSARQTSVDGSARTTSDANRAGTRTAARPATTASSSSGGGSRGYGQGSGVSTTQTRTGTKSSAFSGYQSGQSERAASQRGRSSSSGGSRTRRR